MVGFHSEYSRRFCRFLLASPICSLAIGWILARFPILVLLPMRIVLPIGVLHTWLLLLGMCRWNIIVPGLVNANLCSMGISTGMACHLRGRQEQLEHRWPSRGWISKPSYTAQPTTSLHCRQRQGTAFLHIGGAATVRRSNSTILWIYHGTR